MIKRLTLLILCTCLPALAAFGQGDYMRAAQTVDEYIAKKLAESKIIPAPPSSDAEFIRRVYLDIVGVIPSAEEVSAFLRSGAANKRERLILTLLSDKQPYRDMYQEHWATVWEQWLIGRGDRRDSGVNRATIKSWLRDVVFAKNMPYDEMVRQILTAQGTTEESGPVNFFAKWGPNQADIAAAASRVFLGVRTSCARCHDHKFEKWKQEDFWSYAAFFSRTQGRVVRPRDDFNRPFFAVAEQPAQGELVATVDDGPKKGVKVTATTHLNGDVIQLTGTFQAREELARWMTAPGNPWFAQNVVNKMWDYFLGRGFVNPVDDFRDGNPPSHPEALKFLAEDFAANGYNLKYLIAVITNTKTYQRSSGLAKEPYTVRPGETLESIAQKHRISVETLRALNGSAKPMAGSQIFVPVQPEKAESVFARAQLRPLSPEQLFYSILQAVGADDVRQARSRQALEQMKANYLRRFITLFDNDEQTEQTDFEATIPQALMMMNGDLINSRLSASPILAQLLNARMMEAQRVNLIFLQTLSRPPTNEEVTLFGRLLEGRLQQARLKAANVPPPANGGQPNQQQLLQAQLKILTDAQRQAYEDILWSLVNSSEFMFIH
ncbi:MAG: DUF1553 domain-containing protein [Abditibacteriales bacterium]|nr:DUF1553 domain-containing protein [Abditibacteriales bacterium]MDW8365025.1 DUF1553 domain-containing protein [Abditibacteriales bacterium]